MMTSYRPFTIGKWQLDPPDESVGIFGWSIYHEASEKCETLWDSVEVDYGSWAHPRRVPVWRCAARGAGLRHLETLPGPFVVLRRSQGSGTGIPAASFGVPPVENHLAKGSPGRKESLGKGGPQNRIPRIRGPQKKGRSPVKGGPQHKGVPAERRTRRTRGSPLEMECSSERRVPPSPILPGRFPPVDHRFDFGAAPVVPHVWSIRPKLVGSEQYGLLRMTI